MLYFVQQFRKITPPLIILHLYTTNNRNSTRLHVDGSSNVSTSLSPTRLVEGNSLRPYWPPPSTSSTWRTSSSSSPTPTNSQGQTFVPSAQKLPWDRSEKSPPVVRATSWRCVRATCRPSPGAISKKPSKGSPRPCHRPISSGTSTGTIRSAVTVKCRNRPSDWLSTHLIISKLLFLKIRTHDKWKRRRVSFFLCRQQCKQEG